jgi:hypothetical protein
MEIKHLATLLENAKTRRSLHSSSSVKETDAAKVEVIGYDRNALNLTYLDFLIKENSRDAKKAAKLKLVFWRRRLLQQAG